jgi:hypothetical protein
MQIRTTNHNTAFALVLEGDQGTEFYCYTELADSPKQHLHYLP